MSYFLHRNSRGVILSFDNKGAELTDDGGIPIMRPEYFVDIPKDKALVCLYSVGDNQNAAVICCEEQFKYWLNPDDKRLKHFMLVDKEYAIAESGAHRDCGKEAV